MIKLSSNFERRSRQTMPKILLGSLFLFSPPLIAQTQAHMAVVVQDEDKDLKSSVAFQVVAEQSQEPLIGAVVRCEGIKNPAITNIDGRCSIKFIVCY